MRGSKFLFLALSFSVFWLTGKAQPVKISGTVRSAAGNQPLNGVSVVIKGTQNGTVTDNSGKFLVQGEVGNTLVITYVGFLAKEVRVENDHILNIQLETSNEDLDEIVVVGYGSQRKGDITGAISSISAKALKEVPVTSASQMLQGRAAGVYVVSDGNKPGSGVSVQIRGRRSFNAGNDPLYVVDGIPISGGLNDINPDDIQSMEILKDASATAIYGSRGANGVVIVTTKRGTVGGVNINYDTYQGISKLQRHADIMNGEEFAEYKREASRAVINPSTGRPIYDDEDPNADVNSGIFGEVELESIALGRWTDWRKLVVKDNGHIQNHGLSINGGTESTRFNVSLGYFRDVGIVKGKQDYTRYTMRLNIDQNFGSRIRVGVSSLGSYSERNGADLLNSYMGNSDHGAITENPLGVPYDANGNLLLRPTGDGLRTNPLLEFVPGSVINLTKPFRLLASTYGEVDIIDGLKFRMNFGPDFRTSRTGDFRGSLTNSRQGGDPSASNSESFSFLYTWENLLTYQKTFGGKHSLNVTGLYSVQTSQLESTNISVLGLPVESLEYYNLGAASTINAVGSNYQKWSILSYMARINYGYDDRFLITLTGRADGSSKFAKGSQWGYFPSLAFGWNIKNEDFLKDDKLISNLKLRASYGETGNEGILPYQTQGLVSRTFYDFDGTPAFGYRPLTIRNNNLRWESTATYNAGIDFGIFNNRITGALELYQSKTHDLLLPQLLPITSGFESILSNVGSKRNRGIEFSISTINIVPKNPGGFEWSTDLNLFSNKEEILELSQGKVDDVGNQRFIGYPAVVYYDFVKEGIWQLGQEAEAEQYSSAVGSVRVKDVNGNGIIDPDDRQILGSDVPKLSGGMTHRFSYKGFDLSIFTFARFGNMIQSTVYGSFRFLSGRNNNYDVDYWTKDNPTNAFPQPNTNYESALFASTLRYFDGSFVKIKNINFGYNFTTRISSYIGAQSLRVYLSANDPFVFSPYISKYNGIDPERPATDNPPIRTFLMGLNVKF